MDEFKDYVRTKPNEPRNYSVYMPLIYALLIVLGVVMGLTIARITADKRTLTLGNRQYQKIQDIIDFIKVRYVDTVNTEQLTDQAIEKLLSGLDPHSVYIPRKDLAETNESLDGNFEGIGIEFFIVQDTIIVVSAISGGPAELVGIRAGDKIVSIADTNVAGVKIKNEEVTHKLRGLGGTKVRVGILRSGAKKVEQYTITRDKIPLYSIDAAYMLTEKTGYIKINRFSATTHKEFRKRLKELNNKGMKDLILDLRQNPGGYLNAATEILDELIAGEKMLVYTKGKNVERVEYKSGLPGEFERGRLAVLIDQGSASASEIISGAVQDWDRGIVVGRTSFGKGLVQEQYELPDGSALRLTVARYYTPSGRSIQRPYDDGNQAYFEDINNRYSRGELAHADTTPTRDTTTYRTVKGRVVYGGGGIRPDVFVPLDTTDDLEFIFRVRAIIPAFVYSHFSAQPTMLDVYNNVADFYRNYNLPGSLLSELKKEITDAGIKYDQVRYARSAARIEQFVKAYLAKQKWQSDGFFYAINQGDKVILAAQKELLK